MAAASSAVRPSTCVTVACRSPVSLATSTSSSDAELPLASSVAVTAASCDIDSVSLDSSPDAFDTLSDAASLAVTSSSASAWV